MRFLRRALAVSLTVLAMNLTHAAPLPRAAKPEEVGLSSQRLQRVTESFNADVTTEKIPGAVVLVTRRGKVAYFQTFGFQDRAAGTAMKPDSVFRLASLTKPVTMVAALMLAEAGKLQLMDPISTYLPQLQNLQVGVEVQDGSGERRLTRNCRSRSSRARRSNTACPTM